MHNLLQAEEWSNQKSVGPGLQVYGLAMPLSDCNQDLNYTDSKAQDSGFHKQRFPDSCSPESGLPYMGHAIQE